MAAETNNIGFAAYTVVGTVMDVNDVMRMHDYRSLGDFQQQRIQKIWLSCFGSREVAKVIHSIDDAYVNEIVRY